MLGLTSGELLIAAGAAVLSIVVSTAIVIAFVVWIDHDHFVSERPSLVHVRSPALRITLRIGRNLLGLLLVCMGILLSLPGVPGQGLLTIFVGLLLVDFPGKRRILLRIVRRRAILRSINKVRARFHKEPLEVERDDDDDAHPSNVAEP